MRSGKRTRSASGCWGASGSSRRMVDLGRSWTARPGFGGVRWRCGTWRRCDWPARLRRARVAVLEYGRSVAGKRTLMATLTPHTSPRTPRRKPSARRRALSHLQSHDAHDAALHAIRTFLKLHTAYDAFPVSFRLIVLDTKLNVKKALQCLLLNGMAL